MNKYIKSLLLICIPVVMYGQTDTTQNSDGYITPVFERGCGSCYSPIHLENYCHQIKLSSVKLYDLKGSEFTNETKIPIGTIYIKTGLMMDVNRREYPFISKLIKFVYIIV